MSESSPDQPRRTRFSGKRRTVIIVVALVIALGASLFVLTLRQIFTGVQDISQQAQEQYGGDRVEALLALTESEQNSYRDRNRAIWALGQLGDERALPLLRQLDSDEEQPIPYDRDAYIVQYTVEKAIRHIESDFTLTRWMYHWL
ncbi:MAG: hypothetical protein ABIF77_13570 [bacterium]